MPNNQSKPQFAVDPSDLSSCTQLAVDPYLTTSGFAINTKLNIFVCLPCGNGHTVNSCLRHFKDHSHLKTNKEKIKELGLRYGIPESEWPTPAALASGDDPMIGVPHYEGIHVVHRVGCEICPFVTSPNRRQSMVDHYKDKHRGVPCPRTLPIVPTQQINKGANTVIFRVEPVASGPVEPPKLVSDDLMKAFLKDDWPTHFSDVPIDSRRVTAWLKRTNWHIHIHGLDPILLRNAVALPTEEEFPRLRSAILDYALSAFDESESFSAYILRRLNTHDPSTGIDHKPFQRPQLDETISQYTVVITHLIAALLREPVIYTFPINTGLRAKLDTLHSAIQLNSPYDVLYNALHGVFVQLWHTTYREDTNTSFPDPTICFLILFSLNEDGSFKEPKDLTHPLRQLIWFITLVTIQEIVALKNANVVESFTEAMEDLDGFLREGRETSFSELWALQHFASFYAFNTPNFPHIWWRDRPKYTSMLYRGQLINLGHIHQVVRFLQENMVDIWENKICFGLDVAFDVGELRDDMSNSTVGFSFMSHPHNQLDKAKGRLYEKLITNPTLNAKCFYDHPSGYRALKPSVANKWLADLADLELHLLMSFQILGGSPPRFTEVASTSMVNTPFMRRNIYAVGHQLGLIVQYTKTTRNKGTDSLIPHGFDAFGGDLLFRIHAIARPLARHIVRERQPVDNELVLKYATVVFMGEKGEIQSQKYKDFWKKTFFRFLGWDFLPSGWRHSCIAWGRMHCDSIEHLEERMTQEETLRAEQSGHTHATDRRLYGVDADSVGSADHQTIMRMLEVSVSFQLLFRAIPAGGNRWLSYREAFCDNFDAVVASDFLPPNMRHYISPANRNSGTIPSIIIEEMETRIGHIIGPLSDSLAEVHHSTGRLDAKITTVMNANEEISNTVTVVQQSISRIEEMMMLLVGGVHKDGDPSIIQQITPPVTDSTMHSASLKYSTEVLDDVFLESHSGGKGSMLTPSNKDGEALPSSRLLSSPTPTNNSRAHEHLGEILVDSTPAHALELLHTPSKTPIKPRGLAAAIPVTPTPTPHLELWDSRTDSSPRQSSSHELLPIQVRTDDQAVDALATLRTLLNDPTAVWRSPQQLRAVEAMVNCHSDLMVLIRTGGGKTLPVVITALTNPGITVVAVHFKSLIADWMIRLTRMGVLFEVYDPTINRRPTGMERIVLVMADRFISPGFQRHMQRIATTNYIRTVVIDEAHAWLPVDDFRQKVFSHIDRLRFQPFQLVFLTATLPPVARPLLANHASLHPEYELIANDVVRPEIKLGVTKPLNVYNKDDLDAWVNLMYELFVSVGGKKKEDRVMIYCQTINTMRQVKSRLDEKLSLNIPLYYSGKGLDIMTPEQQALALKRWRDGESWIILCTNAFSAGVDEPNVRMVFHYGGAKDFIDTIQEQDRAGRSGQDAFAYIIPLAKPPHLEHTGITAKWGEDVRGYQILYDVLYRHITNLPFACLVFARTLFLTGNGVSCSNVAAMHRRNWCSRCQAHAQDALIVPLTDPEEYEPYTGGCILLPKNAKDMERHLIDTFGKLSEEARERIIKLRTQKDEELAQFEYMFAKLQGVCTACYAYDRREGAYHSLRDSCEIPSLFPSGHDLIRRLFIEPRFTKAYNDAKGCFRCYAAGMGSDTIHAGFGSNQPCPYRKDLLVGLAYVVFTLPEHRSGFIDFANIPNWTDEDAFLVWLSRANHTYQNNFMHIMKYFIELDAQW